MICPECGEYAFSGHKCDPVYSVYCPEDDYRIPVHARSASGAAEKFAEVYDSEIAEYICVDGSAIDVEVTPPDAAPDATPQRFRVFGESVPVYHAEAQ